MKVCRFKKSNSIKNIFLTNFLILENFYICITMFMHFLIVSFDFILNIILGIICGHKPRVI